MFKHNRHSNSPVNKSVLLLLQVHLYSLRLLLFPRTEIMNLCVYAAAIVKVIGRLFTPRLSLSFHLSLIVCVLCHLCLSKVAWKTCQISHVRGFLTASTLILQASNVLQSYQQLHCKKRKKSKLSQVLTFLLASSGAHSLLLLLPSLQSPMRVPPYLMPLPFSLFRLGQEAADDVEKEVKICIHGLNQADPFLPHSHTLNNG